MSKDNFLVGVISDTHGLLRPGVAKAFKDVDLIIHAGDIDRYSVLKALQDIAPVKVVRGNMDYGQWADVIPLTEVVEIGNILVYVLHNIHELDLDPAGAGFSAVISGHTHVPFMKRKDGVLFLNPGSAGPRRYDYPISAALLRVQGTSLDARIVHVDGS